MYSLYVMNKHSLLYRIREIMATNILVDLPFNWEYQIRKERESIIELIIVITEMV